MEQRYLYVLIKTISETKNIYVKGFVCLFFFKVLIIMTDLFLLISKCGIRYLKV